MTSRIYLSSDTQLPNRGVRDEGIKTKQNIIYFTLISMESFFFEENFHLENQSSFSYSKHFSEAKYQVASINLHLPKTKCKRLNQDNKNALHELFNYITNHFENSYATYVEVLFCLNGSENFPLKQEKLVSHDRLTIDDLYYEELKFIRIDTQMTEFVFRRKIA